MSGRRVEAKAICRRQIGKAPDNVHVLWLLGELCYETGEVGEARIHFGRAISAAERKGTVVPLNWRLSLGALHQRQKAEGKALECFTAAALDHPNSAAAHFCIATVYQSTGMTEQAIARYERVLRLAPNHIAANNNLGILLRDAGRHGIAEQAFRRALRMDPHYAEALENYGNLLQRMGRFTEAQRALLAAERENPHDRGIQKALAQNELLLGEILAAKERLSALARENAEDTVPLTQLASICLFEGDSAEAVRLCREALRRYRSCAAAHFYLAAAQYDLANAARTKDIRRALKSPGLTANEKSLLLFAGAARLDAAGDYGEAFSWYRRANALRRRMLSAEGTGYDRERHDARVEKTIAGFGAGSFVSAEKGLSPARPVFIVGMPRSGTSLVEQILSSHREIAGAGELPLVAEEVARLSQSGGFPEKLPDRERLERFAAAYEERLSRVGPGARHVTDKRPTNFLNLGFIALAFPGATVIHCRRDRRDTILSCYFQNFVGAGLPFSYDLEDLAHYYGAYERIMNHWRSVLPLRMLEIDYENLVFDLETETRRLLEFLGVPWNDACLEFHRTKRPVLTASHMQVRQPVYTKSVGRWRNYARRLEFVR